MTKVSIYYLEMKQAKQLKPKQPIPGLTITEAEIKNYRVNRFLYSFVGEQWQWFDKLNDTEQTWKAYAEREELRTWVAYYQGSIVGYFELEIGEQQAVEIKYFGLAPEFIGQGFGGYLLTYAIQQAWTVCHAKRVWVHTCSLDHPSALANYKARGLALYQQKQE
ncbi:MULTISPECIES: GNAT family N-acetyltransferase [Psychromonas]|uniref:GNAT family N-acetyltransferase n=1 Tax=Psychromonas TaxID=67572 RepID=UPI000416C2E3|nr:MULTISPECIES: GNAT family N-acetyltransferase [Psychromonas]MBB1273325.1 GNAT family N-acetyltransferase [Psychromonas sp. SR45-3]